jgi:hypothetical protein
MIQSQYIISAWYTSVKLEWVVVKKKVYNIDTQKTEYIRFLRLNVIHKYNHTMVHVDVADQLRGSYQIDIYARNRKWWRAIMFLAFGTLLNNTYVIYIKVNIAEGVDQKQLYYLIMNSVNILLLSGLTHHMNQEQMKSRMVLGRRLIYHRCFHLLLQY